MEKIVAILTCVLILGVMGAQGQKNPGFEYGLAGWQISGNKSGAAIDSINAYQGNFCAKISSNTGLFQRVPVSPFSILQFNIFLKCSDPKTNVFSFVRFYDARDHELLEYKSGP